MQERGFARSSQILDGIGVSTLEFHLADQCLTLGVGTLLSCQQASSNPPAWWYSATLRNWGTAAVSKATSASTGQSLFIEEKGIEIYREGQVSGLPPNQSADWIVNVTLTLRTAIDVQKPVMEIALPQLNLTSGPLPFKAVLRREETTMIWASFKVDKNIPDLWFPHNLGAPVRYNITVKLPQWNTSFTTTTGFRTIVLVQEPYSKEEVASPRDYTW